MKTNLAKYLINTFFFILILEASLQTASYTNQYLLSFSQDTGQSESKISAVILGDCFTLEPSMIGNTYPDILERKMKKNTDRVNIINDSFLYASSMNIYDKLQERIDFLKKSKTTIAISMIPSLLVNDTYYFPFKKQYPSILKFNSKILNILEMIFVKYKIYSLVPNSYIMKNYIKFYKEEKIREGLDFSSEIESTFGKKEIGKIGQAWFNLYLYIRLKDNQNFVREKLEAQKNAKELFAELSKKDIPLINIEDIVIGFTLANHDVLHNDLELIPFIKEIKRRSPSLYFFAINQYYRINNNIKEADNFAQEAFKLDPFNINIIEALISSKIALKDYESANIYFQELTKLSDTKNDQFQLSHNYFLAIQKTLEENNIKHIALTHPDQNLDTLKKLYSNSKNITYIDLSKVFKVKKDNIYSKSMYPFVNYGLQEDEVTIAGHKLIAEIIFNAIKDEL